MEQSEVCPKMDACDSEQEGLKQADTLKKNIILIGMPGCGKTTVGKMLAATLQRNFVDMDAAIEAEAGKSISCIFEQQGEVAFRQMETEWAKKLAKQNGLVISTGGGVVTREENMKALCQSGVVLFLDRPLEKILAEGTEQEDNTRPLLSKDRKANLMRLYRERVSLYEKYSHIRIPNNDTADIAIKTILKKMKEANLRQKFKNKECKKYEY